MFDIFFNLVRSFGFVLDNIVYSLIPIIYKLFIYLSEINLFSMDESTPIGALIGRIYVFLGIFMLFKVTFSLIQYLIDPNSFTDKSKGFGKLVTNAMVTILLLVSVPYIFNYAMVLQNKIVTSNAIGTLIMGNSMGSVMSEQKINEKTGIMESAALNVKQVNEMATDVQFLMYGAFFSVNPKAKISDLNEEGNNVCASSPVFGSIAMAQNEDCLKTLNNEFNDNKNDMVKYNVVLENFFKNTNDPTGEKRDFGKLDKLLWWKDSGGEYVINYLPFVSAAAGLYVVFLLVTFSVDIAVRAIKLCFLEMIAPIAIVSYIDPKESMSNSKLRNWIKESLTTYFSLFLRLATLFLVMLLISVIASSVLAQEGPISKQITDMETGYNIWIYLFLIIGAFMFAKKVPQMIENIFGIKMSGDLSLNPFKSIKENVIGNPLVSGAIGGAIGAGATAAGAFATSRSMDRGIGRSLLSAAGGLGSGFARGGVAGAQAHGKNLFTKAGAAAGQTTRAMELRGTTKFGDRVSARLRNTVGAQSKYETLENRAKMYESVSTYADQMKDRAKSEMGKKDDKWKITEADKITAEQKLKNGTFTAVQYRDEMTRINREQDQLVAQYINNGGLTNYNTGEVTHDVELAHSREALDRVVKENKLEYDTSDWKKIDDSSKVAKAEASNIRASDQYENAKAVHEMQKSGMMQSHIKK